MNESVSIFNFGFCLNYHFIVKQVICFIITTIHPCASHIDTTTLADGTYELVPESESEQREAQVNLTEAAQDPNRFRKSPDPATPRKASPRACPTILNLCTYYCSYLLVHLSLQELTGTLVA